MAKGLPRSLKNAALKNSTTVPGPVVKMPFTAQLTAAPTQADFNALLTKLIAAGHMSAS